MPLTSRVQGYNASYNNPYENSSFIITNPITIKNITIAYWYDPGGNHPAGYSSNLEYYLDQDPIWSFGNYTNGIQAACQNGSPFLKIKNVYQKAELGGLGGTNGWVHVVITMTFDGKTQLYENGVPTTAAPQSLGSIAFTPILPLTECYFTMPFFIRTAESEPPSVAEFRIYDYILSAEEVTLLFQTTSYVTPTTSPPPPPTTSPAPTKYEDAYDQIIDVMKVGR